MYVGAECTDGRFGMVSGWNWLRNRAQCPVVELCVNVTE